MDKTATSSSSSSSSSSDENPSSAASSAPLEVSREQEMASSNNTDDDDADNNYQNSAVVSSKSILLLPEHFLIAVLKCFDLRERLRLARVCKKFNRFVKDCALWLRIDLRSYTNVLSLHDLKKLIVTYGTGVTRELYLCGNNDDKKLFIPTTSGSHYDQLPSTSQSSSATKQLLTHLDADFVQYVLLPTCSHLQCIYLEHLNLEELRLSMFLRPLRAHLKRISLSWCKLSPNFFDDEMVQDTPSLVESLTLTKISGGLQRADIERICHAMPELREFCVNQAHSTLDDDSLGKVATRLRHLERLDFTNTCVTDAGISYLCSMPHFCDQIVHLNLSLSSRITNQALGDIAQNLLNLRSLYLTSCFGISSLKLLENLRHLSYLNLNNTSIVNDSIYEVMVKLPACEVEFGHTKLLNQKLTWTINGSRNSVCSF